VPRSTMASEPVERAAMAIKNFLAKKELPEKPLFWHLIENLGSTQRLTKLLEERIRETGTSGKAKDALLLKKFIEKQILKTIFFLLVWMEGFLKLKFFVFVRKTLPADKTTK
ncbi:MAG: hypothetical protein AAB869_03080, partial [Patescibacteria group bacterium]